MTDAEKELQFEFDVEIMTAISGAMASPPLTVEEIRRRFDEATERHRRTASCPDGCLAGWDERKQMKRLLPLVFILLPTGLFAGAFSITEENDVFGGETDRYYTQGAELMWMGDVEVLAEGKRARMAYGLRNLIYTPEDIAVAEPQPKDRPWAGFTAAEVSWWRERRDGLVLRTDLLLGMAGPSAQSEFFQSGVHRLIGSRKPMGWDNQIPDEPVLNLACQVWRPLGRAGEPSGWSADLSEVCAGSLGTAFVDGFGGAEARAGWRVPSSRTGAIFPTAAPASGPYDYLTGLCGMKAVAHNAMLGGSLFRDWDGREMKRLFMEASGGAAVGWRNLFRGNDLELSYWLMRRGEEFEGQNGPHIWGIISVRVGAL